MVAQDPVRLSEQVLAWANQMTKGQVLYAWRSLGVRLSGQKDVSQDNARLAFAWRALERTVSFQFWAAYKVARLSDGMLAWAKLHLAVQNSRILKPFFIQKSQFDPPITQNDFLQCLQVLYAT